MNQCEMCGKREADNVILVEGAKLSACRSCSRHGKILFVLREEEPAKATATTAKQAQKGEEEIVEDYAKIIHNAREKAGLTRLQLGMKIGERENYLEAIEQKRITPTLAIAKKLEKFLGIKLIEKETEGGIGSLPYTRGGDITLADMITQDKKKKQ